MEKAIPSFKRKMISWIGPLLGLVLFVAALWVLHHELSGHHFREVLQELRGIPGRYLVSALFLTLISYMVMTGYDYLALKTIGKPMEYGKIALASFTGYAFSNNIGLSMIAGASVRYRLYSSWGLSALEITQIVFLCILSLWLGFFLVGGTTFIISPTDLPAALHLPFENTRPIGVFLLLAVIFFIFVVVLRKKPIRIKDWVFEHPLTQHLIAQLIVASLDWILAASVLYALLPKSENLPYLACLSIYLMAQLMGLISQVPGGLGVFESVFLVLVSGRVSAPSIIGALLAYRFVYYIIPFGVATGLLGAYELSIKKTWIQRFLTAYSKWGDALLPPVLSFATFISGAILLFSGATPTIHERLIWLEDFSPLSMIEISHFLASAIGMQLLLLSRGIQRRLDGAYWVTLILLGIGSLASILKGFDFEEALILMIVFCALLPSRKAFYRKTSLLNESFTPSWWVAIGIVLICSVWLLLFSYKHVEYSSSLWWEFAFHNGAPRALRAGASAMGVLLIFGVLRLFGPFKSKQETLDSSDLESILPIVNKAPDPSANLALLGDKSFLLNKEHTAFIMYAVEGRSWVSMGDPVGPESEWPDLIWQFREKSDRYGGWPIFYEVGAKNLHYYLDLGLTLTKLGENAKVKLDTFTLEGGSRKALRQQHRKLQKEGCSFEVIPQESISSIIPMLENVSDAWLMEKNAKEKGFSLGFFDADYLNRFPVAVVKVEEDIVAFANLWASQLKETCSIDLMRYHPEKAPRGVMDYFFVELLLWSQHQGYEWFDLGMAPFTGMETRALAPTWNRFAAFVAKHGEQFYNFQGLRHYKDKFGPEWEPRYLASPGGIAFPYILANLISLVSKGPKVGDQGRR